MRDNVGNLAKTMLIPHALFAIQSTHSPTIFNISASFGGKVFVVTPACAEDNALQ